MGSSQQHGRSDAQSRDEVMSTEIRADHRMERRFLFSGGPGRGRSRRGRPPSLFPGIVMTEGSDTSPLPRQVVMVTGAGGPAGVSVIQALARAGHRTVGVDASREAVGIRLADVGATLPRADDPGFGPAVGAHWAGRLRVTAVIPSVAEELVALAESSPGLDAAGIAHWLPRPDAVESCTDKWRFHQAVVAVGLPVPPTALGSADGGSRALGGKAQTRPGIARHPPEPTIRPPSPASSPRSPRPWCNTA